MPERDYPIKSFTPVKLHVSVIQPGSVGTWAEPGNYTFEKLVRILELSHPGYIKEVSYPASNEFVPLTLGSFNDLLAASEPGEDGYYTVMIGLKKENPRLSWMEQMKNYCNSCMAAQKLLFVFMGVYLLYSWVRFAKKLQGMIIQAIRQAVEAVARVGARDVAEAALELRRARRGA